MRTALDSSVILDVLTDEAGQAERSAAAIRMASGEGALLISECALAEVFPACPDVGEQSLLELLKDWQVEMVPSESGVALHAGRELRRMLDQPGGGEGLLPFLMIACHARANADRLLARRPASLVGILENLEVIEP